MSDQRVSAKVFVPVNRHSIHKRGNFVREFAVKGSQQLRIFQHILGDESQKRGDNWVASQLIGRLRGYKQPPRSNHPSSHLTAKLRVALEQGAFKTEAG